ncbi:MAG: hypothetical protein K0R15_2033 [Clostridiales bacterium]|jgi:preprotein translocase subunit SecE|nr:hypothetical protein [Clostridiales bacterium]
MGETNNESSVIKKSWIKELKGEFKKIIWPDKESLVKQTALVLFISVLLGTIIYVIDLVFSNGAKFLF